MWGCLGRHEAAPSGHKVLVPTQGLPSGFPMRRDHLIWQDGGSLGAKGDTPSRCVNYILSSASCRTRHINGLENDTRAAAWPKPPARDMHARDPTLIRSKGPCQIHLPLAVPPSDSGALSSKLPSHCPHPLPQNVAKEGSFGTP